MTFFLSAAAAAAALSPVPAAAQHHGAHQAPTDPPHRPAQPAQPQDEPAPARPATPDPHAGHAMPAEVPAAPPRQDAPPQGESQAMDHAAMGHAAMDHAGHGADHMASMIGMGSGTARLPDAEGPMRGVHIPAGDWQLMAHGYVWGAYTEQTGPRGDDMAFVQSMAMLMADRDLGGGVNLQLRGMWSLEPLMGRRGYPNLFATGETAFGEKLIDRQHPHDFLMELAAKVDVELGDDATAFVYGGPVGEPALGPAAFMHRRSASYMTLSPITHHWFDSTHITFGVATAGVRVSGVQAEGSIFTGREPDEERWGIDRLRFDSWSGRLSWAVSPNWVVQASHGRLKSPEVLHPDEDEARTTASVHYASGTGVTATAAYGLKNRLPGNDLPAWLAEANWDIDRHHSVFGRFEHVANDELFDHEDPLGERVWRVAKLEGGYAYRIMLNRALELAFGGSVGVFAKPDALDAAYGDDPVVATGFVKLTLGR